MNKTVTNILLRIRYIAKWFTLYHKFGEFAKSSYMAKPMRLVNPQYIHVKDNVYILPMARIECFRKWNERKLNGKLTIGSGTSIEQCAHIIAADELSIGNNVTISAFVFISDCNHMVDTEPGSAISKELIVKKTVIEDDAFIGIGARIMPGVTIGKGAVIGANAVVTKDVAPYQVVVGVPATVIKTLK